MIRLRRSGESCVLESDLPGNATAFIDGDWLRGDERAAVPALVCAEGTLSWGAGAPALFQARTPELSAALALIDVADAALAAVGQVSPAETEVVGDGAIAFAARARLGPGLGSTTPPRGIVDTTGDPARLRAAIERLALLGTCVLVGEQLGRELELDLYQQVHRRGVELVGVATPRPPGDPHLDRTKDEVLAHELCRTLSSVIENTPFPPTDIWYRLTSA